MDIYSSCAFFQGIELVNQKSKGLSWLQASPPFHEEMFTFVKNVAEEMRKCSWKCPLLLPGLPQPCCGLTSKLQFTQLVISAVHGGNRKLAQCVLYKGITEMRCQPRIFVFSAAFAYPPLPEDVVCILTDVRGGRS